MRYKLLVSLLIPWCFTLALKAQFIPFLPSVVSDINFNIPLGAINQPFNPNIGVSIPIGTINIDLPQNAQFSSQDVYLYFDGNEFNYSEPSPTIQRLEIVTIDGVPVIQEATFAPTTSQPGLSFVGPFFDVSIFHSSEYILPLAANFTSGPDPAGQSQTEQTANISDFPYLDLSASDFSESDLSFLDSDQNYRSTIDRLYNDFYSDGVEFPFEFNSFSAEENLILVYGRDSHSVLNFDKGKIVSVKDAASLPRLIQVDSPEFSQVNRGSQLFYQLMDNAIAQGDIPVVILEGDYYRNYSLYSSSLGILDINEFNLARDPATGIQVAERGALPYHAMTIVMPSDGFGTNQGLVISDHESAHAAFFSVRNRVAVEWREAALNTNMDPNERIRVLSELAVARVNLETVDHYFGNHPTLATVSDSYYRNNQELPVALFTGFALQQDVDRGILNQLTPGQVNGIAVDTDRIFNHLSNLTGERREQVNTFLQQAAQDPVLLNAMDGLVRFSGINSNP